MAAQKKETRLTPREVARVAFRQWRKMTLVFCGVCASTLVLIAVWPRSYVSESKLFIRVGRESVGLDPTATTGQTINLQKSQTNEVNSALQILNSRLLAQEVVEAVGAQRILDDLPGGGQGATNGSTLNSVELWFTGMLNDVLRGVRLLDDVPESELAVRRLEKGLKSASPKDSTIITVSYRARSPQLAHEIVKAVTNAFVERHLVLNHTDGSLKFFSEQADMLHQELNAEQVKLRDRKNEFQVASIASKRSVFERQLRDVELQMLNTQRSLAYSKARIADLTKAIDGLAPEVVTNRVAGVANVARDSMREKLYELELEESKMRARFKDDHPLLVQVMKQREEAESILKDLPNDRTQTTEGLNLNQRALELELLQEKANSVALSARQTAVEQQKDELIKKLRELNDQEVELTELERNVKLLDGKYRMHVKKQEEARVIAEIGLDGISNVKVAQPATLVMKPAWPNKSLLAALGLAIAVAGAFSVGYLAETFDQTLRTPEQVEQELGLPVLLSLPYRKRGERQRAKAGATGTANGSLASGRRNFGALIGELARSNGNGHVNGNGHAKSVGILSCEKSTLRSRVATELAVQAARSKGEPVLLIDADVRQRRIAKKFRVDATPGLREVLAGVADVWACVHPAKSGNVAVMAPGQKNGQAMPKLSFGEKWARLDQIKSDFGLVVVDLPAASGTHNSPAAPAWLDETVLVVEAERTRVQAAQRAKEMLERAGVRVRGVVLANRREHIPGWLYHRL
jgi:uncharacterized protein involved in exopolysaccharide biosynthesis/Mrp family chromosome partitioning ATPase